MAIRIEFVNLIVPIEKINSCTLKGGFEFILNRYEGLIGDTVWFDQHLLRVGWMDTWEIESEINFFKENGLEESYKKEGVEYWKDMFAISTGINQFSENCDWIEFDLKQNIAWLIEQNPYPIFPNSKYSSFNLLNKK